MAENLTFEQATLRLEEIVKLLEDTKTPLGESLSLFEEGIGLIKQANKILTDAEQKVNILTRKD